MYIERLFAPVSGMDIRIPKDCIVDYIRTSCYNDGRNELLPSEKEV